MHPTSVNTDMIQNAATYELFAADLPMDERTTEILGSRFQELNALPIPWVEPRRHLQRRAVAGLGRVPVRHRGDAAHRRRVAHQVTQRRPEPSRTSRAPTSGRRRAWSGRERELTLTLAAVAGGRDIILEGPPGTSKSTLLRAITAEWGIPFVFVEGNADLTPAKLVGHHNPARVLREDYSEDNFVDGPLLEAMREGGFLYIEEFNRAPEDTLNTLLTAMAERRVAVPRAARSRPSPRSGSSRR